MWDMDIFLLYFHDYYVYYYNIPINHDETKENLDNMNIFSARVQLVWLDRID